jgi:MYXO-CTERM domain-containing protein
MSVVSRRSTFLPLTLLALAGLGSSPARAAVIPGEVIIGEGDIPVGATAAVSDIRPPYVNGQGEVGFMAVLVGGDVAVMRDDTAQWLNSDEMAVTLTSLESRMGISDAGDFVYRPAENGSNVLWTSNGRLIGVGDQAPGLPGGTLLVNVRASMMTPGGAIYFLGSYNASAGNTEEGRALYTTPDGTAGSITTVFRTGSVLDSQTVRSPDGIDLDYHASDDTNHLIAEVSFDTGNVATWPAIVVDDTVVAQAGGATGDGDNWQVFDLVAINNDGDYLFSGNTDGAAATADFLAYNGAIAVREGDTLDSVTLNNGSAIRFVGINNFGQAAFSWADGSGGAGDEHLFWACDASDIPGTVQRVLTVDDDMIDVDGDMMADFTVTDIRAGSNAPTIRTGEDYSVVLEVQLDDGVNAPFDAMIRVPVTCCGNAMPDPGEECDDGNADNTDDCLDTCEMASCGDGFIWSGMEECDDGNTVATDACTDTCQDAVCGDMIVWTGMEECDDGNMDDTDACTNICENAECGDGIIWAGTEECDDSNTVATDACTDTCQNAVCGDMIVWAGMEECDDGNMVDTDMCANDCTPNMGTTGDTTDTDSAGTDSGGSGGDTDSTGGSDTDGTTSTSSTTGGSDSASSSTTDTSSTSSTTGIGDTDSDSAGESGGPSSDDGCSCTTNEKPRRGPGLLVLLGLLGLARRRRVAQLGFAER